MQSIMMIQRVSTIWLARLLLAPTNDSPKNADGETLFFRNFEAHIELPPLIAKICSLIRRECPRTDEVNEVIAAVQLAQINLVDGFDIPQPVTCSLRQILLHSGRLPRLNER